jgi:alpha-beta hydrolase superfamily lysophospholipase
MNSRCLRLAGASVFFLLTACATPDAVPTTTLKATVTPHLTPDAFIAPDGAELPMRRWLPEGDPKAVIVAVHGINDYSHAFEMPATEWAKQGIATFAYDQRGFGAGPDRGNWVGTRQLDADLSGVAHEIRKRYPNVPLYLLGESMGGAVVITAAAGSAGAIKPDADGIILVAPAVWGKQTLNIFLRATLWAANTFAPRMTLTGSGLKIMPSDNIEMLREFSRDPLVIKATKVETISGLVDLMTQAQSAAPKLNQRMIVLYGGNDQVVPAEPVKRFVEHLPPAPQGHRVVAWYEKGYHMLLRDLERSVVEEDVASWIFAPDVPLPSGAEHRADDKFLHMRADRS